MIAGKVEQRNMDPAHVIFTNQRHTGAGCCQKHPHNNLQPVTQKQLNG
jgi:hypothetical protein